MHGDFAVSDSHTPVNTFLVNATEIGGDYDGLCESNEVCTFSGNFGAFQGEGDPMARSCTFTDGTVFNVTMYARP